MMIDPEEPVRLTAWLVAACQGVDVAPSDPFDALSTWKVEVNNGLGGHDGMGATIAVCSNQLEAELIASAIWALVEKEKQNG